jgi:hypothetical protein
MLFACAEPFRITYRKLLSFFSAEQLEQDGGADWKKNSLAVVRTKHFQAGVKRHELALRRAGLGRGTELRTFVQRRLP